MFEKTLAGGTIQTYFDSISEWVSAMNQSCSPYGSNSFSGDYNNVGDAYKASLSSSKYTSRINAVTSKLVSQIAMSMPDTQPAMDVVGLGYDVGLALSGVPECWLTMTPSKDPKIVKILYNTMISGSLSQEQIIAKGIAISALIVCLEMAGIGVEVVVCGEGYHPGTDARAGCHYFITLKKADDYFDVEKFSFAICDPSFPRMLGFCWIASRAKASRYQGIIKWPEGAYQAGGSRGGVALKGEGYDLEVSRSHSIHESFKTLEATKAWVIAKCREFGVEISNPPLA